MIHIKKFTFNPFQENTYLLYEEKGECIIIDPGCMDAKEEQELSQFIASKELKPSKLFNTHAHLDHVFGNKYVSERYQIDLYAYKSELDMYQLAVNSSKLYGLPYHQSPEPKHFLKEGDHIEIGEEKIEVIFVPGHSPDHIVFFNKKGKWLIGGDVLFQRSIGRTDLPGGNHEQLIQNIQEKIFPLDEDTVVYSGHGPETTIGEEKSNNPFF